MNVTTPDRAIARNEMTKQSTVLFNIDCRVALAGSSQKRRWWFWV